MLQLCGNGLFVISLFTNMIDTELYDAAIIGGGLAGLSLAILCAEKDFRVILFEKEEYPFHKVCGEYISGKAGTFYSGWASAAGYESSCY